MNTEKITALLDTPTFERLLKSIPKTRNRGRLQYWQEKILAGLEQDLGQDINNFSDFESIFGSAFDKHLAQQKERIKVLIETPSPNNDLDTAAKLAFKDKAPDALEILECYNNKEKHRVKSALLVLSNGQLDLLWKYTELADIDYRDVLMGAEYSKNLDKAERYLTLGLPLPSRLKTFCLQTLHN